MNRKEYHEYDCQDCRKLFTGYDYETRKKNMRRCEYCSEYPLYQVIGRMRDYFNLSPIELYKLAELVKLFQAYMILKRRIKQIYEYNL